MAGASVRVSEWRRLSWKLSDTCVGRFRPNMGWAHWPIIRQTKSLITPHLGLPWLGSAHMARFYYSSFSSYTSIYSPFPLLIPCPLSFFINSLLLYFFLPLFSNYAIFILIYFIFWDILDTFLLFGQEIILLMGCKDLAKVKWRRRRRRRRRQESVGRKMKKLQKLIPGGDGLKPDRLFLRTAEHILKLRLQLNALQALTKIFNIPDWLLQSLVQPCYKVCMINCYILYFYFI